MSKRAICNVHDDIVKECNDIIKKINKCRTDDSPEDLYDVLDDIRWQLDNYIISYAEEAKEYGQAMENRLKDYRSSIEDLGFIRIEK